jgi:methionyl-tRNA formyltransferase
MKVAVITPAGSAHGQHLCAEIAARHDLVGVLHPEPRPGGGARAKLERVRREAASFGVPYELLRLAASAPGGVGGWRQGAGARTESLFPDAASRYAELVAPVARSVPDVNAPEAVEWLAGLGADVGLCLGGPIYRAPLIEAVPLMLNFHSGVSPLYNGTSTIAFAFANGHAHLCGGTLMVMSPEVDGGDILGHYLPAVERDDDPGTLFAKTVRGAAEIALRFLGRETEAFARCPQPPTLFYYRGSDWTVDQGQRVRRRLADGVPEDQLRSQPRIEAYWEAQDDEAAARQVRDALGDLLRLP